MSYEMAKESAVAFIRAYIVDHEFFTGGDILEAFRASGLPGSELDWRNRWGGIIMACHRIGLFARAGRAAPTSKQSHTESLTLWKSRRFKGEQSLSPRDNAASLVSELRKKILCREVGVEDALWQMYDRGWLDRSSIKSQGDDGEIV